MKSPLPLQRLLPAPAPAAETSLSPYLSYQEILRTPKPKSGTPISVAGFLGGRGSMQTPRNLPRYAFIKMAKREASETGDGERASDCPGRPRSRPQTPSASALEAGGHWRSGCRLPWQGATQCYGCLSKQAVLIGVSFAPRARAFRRGCHLSAAIQHHVA
jgi:hypothetical protein